MAKVLCRANRHPSELKDLAFVVLAPQAKITAGTFSTELDRVSMRQKIRERVDAYEGAFDGWYQDWLEPTLASVALRALSWEDAVAALRPEKPEAADSLSDFYDLCLKYN